jgi:radial spoke head protein 9
MKTFLKVFYSLKDTFIIYNFLGWSVQYERGSGLVQIRSLKWLGMAFFHVPETNRFGSLYFGIGEQNKDLPFMI